MWNYYTSGLEDDKGNLDLNVENGKEMSMQYTDKNLLMLANDQYGTNI